MTPIDLSADSEARHEQFLERVVTSGVVWGLKSEEGWVMSSSAEDDAEEAEIMPFWSDLADAQQCATDDWSAYVPTEIPLELFMEHWLPGMASDNCLVGTNWNAQLDGYEIDPLELLVEIQQALEDAK